MLIAQVAGQSHQGVEGQAMATLRRNCSSCGPNTECRKLLHGSQLLLACCMVAETMHLGWAPSIAWFNVILWRMLMLLCYAVLSWCL